MAVPLHSLAVQPHNIGAPQVLANVPALRGVHKMYSTASARIDDNWKPHGAIPSMDVFTGTVNPLGSTIYLPYDDEHITSVRLPDPPPAGVNFFLTANMSGCRFFIDRIVGSNDLIVYHANTHQFGSPPHNTPANFQSAQADQLLINMHTQAQNDYAALAPPNNLTLLNVAALTKVNYYLHGTIAEQRKANQGRQLSYAGQWVAPEFAGGCSVMGFYNGAWSFYYQTWGGVDYTRSSGRSAIAKDLFTFHWKSLHNRRTKGVSHGSTSDYTVVDHALFY